MLCWKKKVHKCLRSGWIGVKLEILHGRVKSARKGKFLTEEKINNRQTTRYVQADTRIGLSIYGEVGWKVSWREIYRFPLKRRKTHHSSDRLRNYIEVMLKNKFPPNRIFLYFLQTAFNYFMFKRPGQRITIYKSVHCQEKHIYRASHMNIIWSSLSTPWIWRIDQMAFNDNDFFHLLLRINRL